MKIGRNDPCPCGSGRKFKHCCIDDPISIMHQYPIQTMSLRDRNLTLLAAVADIFGFSRGRNWDDIKRDISAIQIRELYQVIAGLWPPNTKIENLIQSSENKLRALYLGDSIPEMVMRHICRISLYSDEILIIDPFQNPWFTNEEFSPLAVPDQYKAETLKLIYLLGNLQPWLETGLVTMIPDPTLFDMALRKKSISKAKERCAMLENVPEFQQALNEDLKNWFKPAAYEELERFVWTLPDDTIRQMARKKNPNISEREIVDILAHVNRERKTDPLALDQRVVTKTAQLTKSTRGANMETALFLAQLTGAFPFTSLRTMWTELSFVKEDLPEAAELWSPLTRAFQSLEFKFLDKEDPCFAASIRRDGRLENFRSFLRHIWVELDGGDSSSKTESKIRDFKDELVVQYNQARVEWDEIDHSLMKQVVYTAIGGLSTGIINPSFAAVGFGLASITELLSARYKRTAFRRKNPLSIFIDLASKR